MIGVGMGKHYVGHGRRNSKILVSRSGLGQFRNLPIVQNESITLGNPRIREKFRGWGRGER